jgi:hypothetical protein
MRRKFLHTLFSIITLGILYLTTTSYSNTGSSIIAGAQNASGCICHGAANSALTNISVTGLPSSTVGYTPGATYTVSVNVISSGKVRAGINLGVNVGAITSVGANLTQVNATSLRHSSPKVMTGSATSFSFTWQAPLTGSTALQINAAVNTTDNNGTTSGDRWAFYSTNLPLSISYLDFSASSKANEVRLDWKTAKEEDLEYFVIEKGIDGQIFDSLTRMVATGTPSLGREYQYLDYPPFSGTYYYRLKLVSHSGQENYSSTQKIIFDNGAQFESILFPNPVQVANEVDINVFNNKAEKLNVTVVDIRGLVVYQRSYEANWGTNYLHIPYSFKGGQYFVTISDSQTGTELKHKVIAL